MKNLLIRKMQLSLLKNLPMIALIDYQNKK